MGNTCSPDSGAVDESGQAINTDRKEEEPSEKLTKVINTYQAENEKMKKELESMKNKDEEDTRVREEQAAQNEEIMKELSAMKALMEEKDRKLVRHQLEAALHSKATSLGTSETVTKLLKAGTIEKFDRVGKSKRRKKWVEIHIHSAKTTPQEIKKGFLMLTYADNKSAQVSNRCQIVRVNQEGLKVGENLKSKAFSIFSILSGAEKELAFVSEDEKSREEWIEACNEGFRLVDEEYSTLKTAEGDFFFDVEISKPKLGIRVQEKVLERESTVDEKAAEVSIDKGTDDEKVEAGSKEKPCELVVQMISEKSLLATGLTADCVISALNGTNLRGLTYSEQVGMLESTKRPFTITFLKKKSALRTAFPGILKELVADGDNAVKSAFYDLVKGTPFGIELDKSENKTAAISELLSNPRRLTALLQNTIIQETEL